MNKKVPVVTVAEPEHAANLAGLPLEATAALADLAAAVKEGLLGFCADVGLVVMRQMLDAEMTAQDSRSCHQGRGRRRGLLTPKQPTSREVAHCCRALQVVACAALMIGWGKSEGVSQPARDRRAAYQQGGNGG